MFTPIKWLKVARFSPSRERRESVGERERERERERKKDLGWGQLVPLRKHVMNSRREGERERAEILLVYLTSSIVAARELFAV